MAVMPMQKLLLITMRDEEDKLLRLAQNLQEIELFPPGESHDFEWECEEEGLSDQLPIWEQDYERLQMAQRYLQSHADKKQKAATRELLLRAPTLDELEEKRNHIPYMQITREALGYEQQMQKLVEERKENNEQRNDLIFYQTLPTLPDSGGFQYAESGLYRVEPSKREGIMESMAASPSVYGEIVREDQRDLVIWFVSLQRESGDFGRLRQEFALQEVKYPYSSPTAEILEKNEEKRLTINEGIAEVTEGSRGLARHLADLQISEEVLGSLIERERQKKRLLTCDHVTALTGWIPVESSPNFIAACKVAFGEDIFIEAQEICQGDDLSEVPVRLKNSKLVAPFETITEMYSLPSYDEVDPTPIMSIFYWVFFGMMVADLGYGLLTVILSAIALKVIPFRQGMRKSLRFFHILGYSICVWGLVYGSCFSTDLPFRLLSTTNDVNAILILSMAMGYVQILTGLAIAAYMILKSGEKNIFWPFMKGAGAWIGVLLSIVVLILGAFVLRSQSVQMIGMALMVVFLILVVVAHTLTHRSKAKGLAYGLYEVYGITSYLGDLVSYTRLMALGIAGGSIGMAFNMIIAFLPPAAKFTVGIVLLIGLHALNFFLSMLSAYVHGARLQFVEFFGKFFNGGGRAFKPLKAVERHFDVRAAGQKGKEES